MHRRTLKTLLLAAAIGLLPGQSAAPDDRAAMMRQLGVTALIPGANGDEAAPDHANYDEARANPYPTLPDVLTTDDRRKVVSADMWWKVRRPEIAEHFAREIYGRVPAGVPAVRWRVVAEERETMGFFTPVRVRRLIGHVDGAGGIEPVDIRMTLVTPAAVTRPVPLLVMFGRDEPPAPTKPDRAEAARIDAAMKTLLVKQDPALAAVFAKHPFFAFRIIGLVNGGRARKPDDWGALRAWAWGASRAFDRLATDPTIDARRIGIEGVSRYGKAALVAAAFDQRFAMVLVGSSGKGGATLLRRDSGRGWPIWRPASITGWRAIS